MTTSSDGISNRVAGVRDNSNHSPHDSRHNRHNRYLAALALVLLVPAASAGVIVAMGLMPGETTGKLAWSASKLWLLVLPVAWHIVVDRHRLSFSPMRQGGAAAGLATGIAIIAVIVLAYLLFGNKFINVDDARRQLVDAGLGHRGLYLLMCGYWICINSMIEEYVWRWFVYRKFKVLFACRRGVAVLAAGVAFTAHHTIALSLIMPGRPGAIVLGSLGVLIGGVTWSVLYAKYRSVWPGWISHALADVGVFIVGYLILFG